MQSLVFDIGCDNIQDIDDVGNNQKGVVINTNLCNLLIEFYCFIAYKC